MSDTREALVAQARRTAENVKGPGMGTTIRGATLRALLETIDELQAAPPVPVEEAAVPANKVAKWVTNSPAVVAALADILENNPELWGNPALDALEAWEAQTGDGLPSGWKQVVAKALAQS